MDLTSGIASELYFAAGAFQQGRESSPAVITRPEQTRLYWEAESVIDDLSWIGFPGSAYHLVERYWKCTSNTNPAGGLLRVAATVRRESVAECEYEQVSQDVVLRIVRRCLGTSGALLQRDEECQRALRGKWPQ